MTTVRRPGNTGGTSGTTGGRDVGTIRPMYGVILRDDLSSIRKGVTNLKKQIEGALGRSELMGTNLKDANEALRQINKAMGELEVPGGKMAKKAKDTPAPRPGSGGVGGPVAMYGVVIRDQLGELRSGVENLLSRVDRSIKNGSFDEKLSLQDAKQVKRRLENALEMLNVRG